MKLFIKTLNMFLFMTIQKMEPESISFDFENPIRNNNSI